MRCVIEAVMSFMSSEAVERGRWQACCRQQRH